MSERRRTKFDGGDSGLSAADGGTISGRRPMTASQKRVVITGMGVKTPAGENLETFWETLAAGQSTA